MSLSTVKQLCDEFQGQIKTVTIDQVKLFCDNILVELNRNKDTTNVILLNMVATVLNSIKPEQMNDSRVLDHKLFIILRDALISVMHAYRNNQTMQPLGYGKNVSDLISYITFKFVNDHVNIFKRLLINKPFIDELSECIDKCARNLINEPDEFVEILNSRRYIDDSTL
jgi:hypothetical protein